MEEEAGPEIKQEKNDERADKKEEESESRRGELCVGG